MNPEFEDRKFILDADILSALVKIGRFEQFLQAFNLQAAFIPPTVYQELQACAASPKRILQRLARNIERLVTTGKIKWNQNIITAGQVDTLLGQLKQATRMQFKEGIKDIILAPPDKNREAWFYFNV